MGLKAMIKSFGPDMGFDRSELGRADTLRFNVLTYVVEENYDRAIQELRTFLESDFEYPEVKGKVERYIQHAVDLVHAIRAKRKFPGAQLLTMARQKDLNEKFRAHFSELQYILKKVEKIQKDVRLDDIRSTVWVVRALIASIMIITLVGLGLDAKDGLVDNILNVSDDVFHQITEWFFSKF